MEGLGFLPTPFLNKFIVDADKKRIEDEEGYLRKEMGRRIDIVKVAKGEAFYKSGHFNWFTIIHYLF